MSDSLTAIYVEPHQCPSHQPILLTQGPICESFAKIFWELAILKNIVFLSRPFWIFFFKWKFIFCFFPIKTIQSLLVSKDGSKKISSQTWQHNFDPDQKFWQGVYVILWHGTIPARILFIPLVFWWCLLDAFSSFIKAFFFTGQKNSLENTIFLN